MQTERKQTNRNYVNLTVDMLIFLAFLVAMAPRFSGIAVHEWLSIAFGAAIITHLLLHWQWLVEVTRRFFRSVQWSARINYLLNTLLFIDITIVIFTGIMISEAALPLFGLQMPRGGAWRRLHDLTANLSLLLVGLHIALHWNWIVNVLKRLFTASQTNRRQPDQPVLANQSSAIEFEAIKQQEV